MSQSEPEYQLCAHAHASYCFKELLEQLRDSNHITAGTTWKSIYPVIAEDERYLKMLGQPGSSPLDLFWDMVDEMDLQFEDELRQIEDVLADKKFVITEAVEYEQFEETLKGAPNVDKMDFATKKAAFEKVSSQSAL